MDYEYSKETEKYTKEVTTIKDTGTGVKDNEDKFDGNISIENTDQFLHLMEIYLSEWEHRDSSLWKQAFAYFIFSFAITIFPFVSPWNHCEKLIVFLPKWIFPIIGMILSMVFGFVMLGYVRRFGYIGEVYRKMIKELPRDYQFKSLQTKTSLKETPRGAKLDYILGRNMSVIVKSVMFLTLFFVALIVFIITVKYGL